jgi:uncharacterized protein
MKRVLFIVSGFLSLILGVIGIFIPGLPTTPFLLLAAGLFIRSSPRLYNWLIKNRYLGRYILNYQRRKGMTERQKIYALSLMWVMIIVSAGFLVHPLVPRIVIVFAGVIGTIVMGFFVPLSHDN